MIFRNEWVKLFSQCGNLPMILKKAIAHNHRVRKYSKLEQVNNFFYFMLEFEKFARLL